VPARRLRLLTRFGGSIRLRVLASLANAVSSTIFNHL